MYTQIILMGKTMKRILNERGALIVEASIVFPTMFLAIFFMLFVGNAYMQKCRIENVVISAVLEGAAKCADPMLDDIENGSIPAFNSISLKPYRYLTGSLRDTETDIESEINTEIGKLGTGFFSGMEPTVSIDSLKFESKLIYSKVTVDISYKIKMPIRLLGQEEFMDISYATHTDVPVADVPEFIRNVDFAEDLVQRISNHDISEPANKLSEKITEWTNK